jgi:hypothetical protein
MTKNGALMTDLWRNALWQQFGAAIDMLDDAVVLCPDSLWAEPLWVDHSDTPGASGFTEFRNITHHVLFWLDLYLYGTEEGFTPPSPFTLSELDPAGVVPDPPYRKDVLRAYLQSLRSKCRTIVTTMTDEEARRPCSFPWDNGATVSFFELQLYNMRHVQEHGVQLHMFLGQNVIETEDNWVPRARGA